MNKLKKIGIFAVFISLLFGNISQIKAQVTVEVKLDTNMLLIGDQTKLQLKANYPEQYNVQFPAFADTVIKGLEVLDISNFDTTLVDGVLQVSQDLLVTSFDSGWYQIPPLNFVISTQLNSSPDTLQSVPLYFGVVTIPIDTTNANAITDIKKPIDAPLTFKEVLPFAAIALGAIILVLAAIFLILRLTRKEPIFIKKEKPKEPAHIIAFRDLDALKDKKLWQQGKLKEYYSELTEIIRTYIENRYSVQAMEMTTDEISEALKTNSDIDKDLKDRLFSLLSQADFIKFAKANALADENENNYKFAYNFVNQTKEKVVLRDDEENDEGNDEEDDEDIEKSSEKELVQ